MNKYRAFSLAPLIVMISVGVISQFSSDVKANSGFLQCGKASWYKLTGKTASGEKADPKGMTAAHRTLPFGTLVEVTNLANGQTVTVRINDRGPFSKNRVIDVTLAAAQQLKFVKQGITNVKITGLTDEVRAKSVPNCS